MAVRPEITPAKVASYARRGWSTERIAAELGCSRDTVTRRLKEYRAKPAKRKAR
jgi:DNA-directed RNA polymerase specialized sigma24 family protein